MFAKLRLLLILSMILCQYTFAANNALNKFESYVIYNGQPIAINLPISKSKSIRFVNPISLGMPKNLKTLIDVKNDAGELQLTAKSSFRNKRVEVKDDVSGKMILLDLSAVDSSKVSDSTVDILYKKPNVINENKNTGWVKEPTALQGEMAYATLTRFAEQRLYAPKRLLKNPYNIRLITSYVEKNTAIPKNAWFNDLFIDNSTANLKWAEWYSSGLYVTAVLIRNLLPESIDLTHNLTNICCRDTGVWKAITFFPAWKLQRSGSLSDTTVAFLVTSVPFDQVVNSCREG